MSKHVHIQLTVQSQYCIYNQNVCEVMWAVFKVMFIWGEKKKTHILNNLIAKSLKIEYKVVGVIVIMH